MFEAFVVLRLWGSGALGSYGFGALMFQSFRALGL